VNFVNSRYSPTVSIRSYLLLLGLFYGELWSEPLRKVIDREVSTGWKKEKLEPSKLANDETFLRRVYLDLLGMVPSYEEAKAFLEEESEDKREKLVDQLLSDERFGKHQMQIWDLSIFTRKPANPSFTKDRDRFKDWLAKQFNDNVSWDGIVQKMILAEEEGSAMFHVQYRNKPEDETVAVSRLFLGTQLQCARCHDHPFEELSQKDFYGMAGFFVRLQVLQETKDKKKVYTIGEKSSGEVMFTGDVREQKPGDKGEPVKPKFLLGDSLNEPDLPEDFKEPDYKKIKKAPYPKPYFSRKAKLAEWMTSPDNPYFAKAALNRFWAQFMGRGLVHPVDNLTPDSKPTHPKLMDALAKEFIAHNFDLKWFFKEILLTKAYQRDSAGPGEEATPKWYQRARVRPLSAEELIASLRVATRFDAAESKEKSLPNATKSYMTKIFGEPVDGRGHFQGGIHEHLFLNNGSQLPGIIRAKKGNLAYTILNSEDTWGERMDELFLSTITRTPTEAERNRMVGYITASEDKREIQARLEEAIWTLLNTSRFRFNY